MEVEVRAPASRSWVTAHGWELVNGRGAAGRLESCSKSLRPELSLPGSTRGEVSPSPAAGTRASFNPGILLPSALKAPVPESSCDS